jgi:hypothetical protein
MGEDNSAANQLVSGAAVANEYPRLAQGGFFRFPASASSAARQAQLNMTRELYLFYQLRVNDGGVSMVPGCLVNLLPNRLTLSGFFR